MPFVTIFLIIILAVAFAGLWGLSLILLLVGWWLKKRWLKWVGGIPLVFLSLLGVAAAGLIAWETYASHSPPHVFKESFGFYAPKATKFDSGYWSIFGDSGSAELKFFTDTNTFQQIIATGFVEITIEEFAQSGNNSTNSPSRYFKKDPFGKHFSRDVAYITINDTNGAVYFHWSGID